MQLADPDQYDSSWEWCRAHSRYHFDDRCRDRPGEWYQLLGRFKGDWSSDLQAMTQDHEPITWATRKFYGKDDTTPSPMLRQEEHDLVAIGAPVDLQLTNINDKLEQYPVLYRMAEFFALEDDKRRVHYQLPGQMFNLHIDKLWDRSPDDPDRVVRFTVMLTDWRPGQFYLYGTSIYDRWQAGDIHVFDWQNVPHATANASRYARPMLQITGLKTDRTSEILAKGSSRARYRI